MKRLAALAALLVVSLAGVASAGESPYRFSSPSRAAAGTPIWVRSISACPSAPAGTYRHVKVGFALPDNPSATHGDTSVTGDVRDDGTWEVSLTVPSGASYGSTANWYVGASCYAGDPPEAPAQVAVYEVRELYVTSSGESAGSGATSSGGSHLDEAAVATTTTTAAEATTTTSSTTSTTAGTSTQSVDDEVEAAAVRADAKRRADELRTELAAEDGDDSGVAVDSGDDAVSLLAASASSSSRDQVDGGIPPWAFMAAAMLAIGSVIAWGARRAPSLPD